jgi:tetratricopeptide (TPR) repeat protein
MLPAAVAIVLLAGLVYLPSIHGSKIWDDTELLSGKGLGNAVSIPQCFRAPFLYHYYRPLTSASFLLDHRIWDHGVWGSNTFGYHLTNLLLHVVATALLLPVLLMAFRSRPVALFGALLFAVQPAQVSAVAWIGGRTDSLCTMFIALFLLSLMSGAKSTGVKRLCLLAASVGCYALAALAKEQALFLLPLAPMAIVVFRDTHTEIRMLRVEIAIWTALYIPVAVCLLIAWMKFGDPLHPKWNLAHQLPLIGPTIDYYAFLLITPTPRLNHVMTLYTMDKLGVIGVVSGYLLGILAIVLLIRLMRTQPVAAWFFAGALLLLAPVSNIYPMTTQTIAPYRAATGGIFAASILGWAIIALLERAKSVSSSGSRTALTALPVCIYAVWLCCFTYSDDCVWKNSLTASTAVERYDPDSVFGKLESANAYLEFGSFEPAVARLDNVVSTLPALPASGSRADRATSWDSRSNLADWAAALYGRAGMLKLDAGDRQSAIVVLNKGKALSPRNEQVNAGLARYALAANDLAQAEEPIRNVLADQPELTGLRLRLGKILLQQKRWKEADAEFTICLSQAPSDTTVYLLTALSRIRSGNRVSAAQVINDGLKRHVLERDKLQDWLKTIGEAGLLR